MPPSSAEPLSEVCWAAAQEPLSAVLRAVAADTCTNAQDDTTIKTITASARPLAGRQNGILPCVSLRGWRPNSAPPAN
jgi:hypothetical protein